MKQCEVGGERRERIEARKAVRNMRLIDVLLFKGNVCRKKGVRTVPPPPLSRREIQITQR